MKRIITVLVILVIVSGAINAQTQDADYYKQRMNSQLTVRGKFGIVREADANGDATPELYAYALDALLKAYPNVQGANETSAADNMARFLSTKLGEAQYTEAGLNLWKIVETFFNPMVRGEALIALGKVQAAEFIPHVCQILSDMNLEPGSNPEDRERVAYGAVVALEEYKDSSGYFPVFFVTVGWYSEGLKNRAKEALPNIVNNPTEPLISVIRSSSYNYLVKYGALQTLEAAEDVTTQQKSEGAVAALTETWRTASSLTGQRSILANIRKLSLSMIRRYGTSDANVYTLLENCYRRGIDEEEQIAAIGALSALATDDSVRLLSNFLFDINDRLDRGTLTKEDERLMRVIIPALGNTGRPMARSPLRSVLQKDWTNTVHKLAEDALKKIP